MSEVVSVSAYPAGKPFVGKYRVWIHREVPSVEQLKGEYKKYTVRK